MATRSNNNTKPGAGDKPPVAIVSNNDPRALQGRLRAEAAPAPDPRVLRWEGFDEIEPSDEEDLVQGLLPRRGIGAIYGGVASGKSLVAMDWGMRLGRGKKVANEESERVAVAYVAAEGMEGLRKRIKAYRKKHGLKGVPFVLVPERINLRAVTLPDVAALIVALEAIAAEFDAKGIRLGLVIIDTFAAANPGLVENAGEGMTGAVEALNAIADATEAFVLAVHHTGKDSERGLRGHSSFLAALDATIEVVVKDEDDPVREVWARKVKDGASHRPLFKFTIEVVQIGETRVKHLPRTAALMAYEGEIIGGKKAAKPTPTQDRILTALAQLTSEGKGEHPPAICQAPAGVFAVKVPALLKRAIDIGLGAGNSQPTASRTARRAFTECVDKRLIWTRDEYVWKP